MAKRSTSSAARCRATALTPGAAGSATQKARRASPIARFRATARVKTAAGSPTKKDGTLDVTHGTLSGNTTAPAKAAESLGMLRRQWLSPRSWPAADTGWTALVTGVLTDGVYNLDDDGSCKFSGTSFSDTGAGLDPAGLQYNGGPTETIALESGSAAIDHVTLASDCAGSDQRGVAWPIPCDIGASERR